MSSLSIILVNRLVLNLRERAVNQLPTTFETTESFHVALPPTFVRKNRPTVTATTTFETVASVPAGESPNQQLRSMDAYILSLSSVKQNRSIGETVSVRISTEIPQTAGDETRYVPPLVESAAGSFSHGKEIVVPTQPHIRRDTLQSSSRKSVRFGSICFFDARGRPSALFNPDSDTESDTETDAVSR
jgi:hypothetical protein